MGQKIHPKGLRLGQLYTWDSRWFAQDKRYSKLLLEDIKIRNILMEKLKPAGISAVEIERLLNKIEIIIHVARPGVVIGRGGSSLEELKKYLQGLIGAENKKGALKMELKVEPVKEPNLDAYLVAQSIADQIAKRLPHRRVVKQTIERVMAAGARGVKVVLAGRIAGAEIARREKYHQGAMPLSTLRAKIDFAAVPSLTRSGYVGVKVWICKK